jgi:hypothetical protein
MYKNLELEKPEEGDKVWGSVCEKPMNPRPVIYRKGKFFDLSDQSLEVFPKYWKYPSVPFVC